MSLCLCWFVCCLLDLMWLWVSGGTSQFWLYTVFCWLVTVLYCNVLCNVLRGNYNFFQQRKFSGAGINFRCSFTAEFSDWHLTAPLHFCLVLIIFFYLSYMKNNNSKKYAIGSVPTTWHLFPRKHWTSILHGLGDNSCSSTTKGNFKKAECKSWLMLEENGCHVNTAYNALKQRSWQVRFLLSVSSCFQSSPDAMLTISWQSSCSRCKYESGINLSHLITTITQITIFHLTSIYS